MRRQRSIPKSRRCDLETKREGGTKEKKCGGTDVLLEAMRGNFTDQAGDNRLMVD